MYAWRMFAVLRPPRLRQAADRAHHHARGLPPRHHEEDRPCGVADPSVGQLEERPPLSQRGVQPTGFSERGEWAVGSLLLLLCCC